MSVTSAQDFVSDWRNVAIVQRCVCDQTALSAPSCRMQRHPSTTVNGLPSPWTGAVLLISAFFPHLQSISYHVKEGGKICLPHTLCSWQSAGSEIKIDIYDLDLSRACLCTGMSQQAGNCGLQKTLTALIPRRFVINDQSQRIKSHWPHVRFGSTLF